MNPGLQVKLFTLGKNVRFPDDEPFKGAFNCPQSIASKEREK